MLHARSYHFTNRFHKIQLLMYVVTGVLYTYVCARARACMCTCRERTREKDKDEEGKREEKEKKINRKI